MDPSNPIRYWASYNLRKTARALGDFLQRDRFARENSGTPLPNRVFSASSPIYRKLPDVPKGLFDNKRTNLERALKALNGVLLPPGRTFSLWRLVGPPTRSRGFKEGLMISRGKASRGMGGGLCQLSNMIHWMALHSDLQVTERHRHSFDIFPDEGRTIPFGTGATLLFNYKDIRLFNPTGMTFQMRFELTEKDLKGTLLASDPGFQAYSVFERGHGFVSQNGSFYRKNAIWRRKTRAGKRDKTEELLFENFCLCCYKPKEVPA